MVDYNFDSDIDKDDTYFEFRYIHDKAPKAQLQ
jgi:hypothetical protein